MIRKTIHLVRDMARCDLLTAVVESPREIIESVELGELWSFLTKQGFVPELMDETDWGIDVFSGKYDPAKHADLPVIDLLALDTSSSVSCPVGRPAPPPADKAKVPRKRRNTVRNVVTLEMSVEQYQVKRAVVEVPTADALATLCGDNLWWACPQIRGEGEVDERQAEVEFSIKKEAYKAALHKHLPIAYLQRPIVPDKVRPSRRFLLSWQPSSMAHKKNRRESKRVGGLVGSDPNQCYWNARRVIRSLPDYSAASYVEGFIVTHDGALVEHGWIVKDCSVVDPSILDDATYFPGLEFAGREQIGAFLRTEWGSRFHGRPFYLAFGDFGLKSPSFVEAFRQARECLSSTFGVPAMKTAAVVRAKHGLPWPEELRQP